MNAAQHARPIQHFAEAAFAFITTDEDWDDRGSHAFHLICSLRDRFTAETEAADDPLVRSALAVAIGLLKGRSEEHAVGARLSLERIASLAGMDDKEVADALAMCLSEKWDLAHLSQSLFE